MTYLHYNHVRTRDHEPLSRSDSSDPFYSRPLIRRNSKRQRIDVCDNDEYDDYPRIVKPSKPALSRALTIRQPSQLEKYNVYNTSDDHHHHHKHHKHHNGEHQDDHKHRSSKVHEYYVSRPSERYESDNEYDHEHELERDSLEVKVKATLSRPRSHSLSHSFSSDKVPMRWSGDSFKRKEKWECVDWESRERKRSAHRHHNHHGHHRDHHGGNYYGRDDGQDDGFWDDDAWLDEVVRDVKYRRVKRTRTDEWKPRKPLVGFRRL